MEGLLTVEEALWICEKDKNVLTNSRKRVKEIGTAFQSSTKQIENMEIKRIIHPEVIIF